MGKKNIFGYGMDSVGFKKLLGCQEVDIRKYF
jgi:hypothetical protein